MAVSIEPAEWSMDALHHTSRISEYMKTTFIRLQFVFKVIWAKKNGEGFALLHNTAFLLITKQYYNY